jgi:hypothetical protein
LAEVPVRSAHSETTPAHLLGLVDLLVDERLQSVTEGVEVSDRLVGVVV